MASVFLRTWPEIYVPEVTFHRNLTVSSLGPAFSGKVPVLSSYYGYPYSIAKGSIISATSLAKRRSTKVKLDRIPAFIHSQWAKGYYHWLTESLPRALQVASEFPECVVLIPKSYDSFHTASLKLLGVRFSHFTDHNVHLDHGLLTSCPKHYGTTHRELLLSVRDRLNRRNTSTASFGKRVYISRALARGRKVSNEDEVIGLLRRYGFEVLMPEEFSFEDQASIFHTAKFLIGIHGAGLSNMLFMDKGSSLIELLPYRNGVFDLRLNSLSFKHDNCYLVLAEKMEHKYRHLQCSHDKAFYERTSLANITVDCTSLEKLVKSLTAETA